MEKNLVQRAENDMLTGVLRRDDRRKDGIASQ